MHDNLLPRVKLENLKILTHGMQKIPFLPYIQLTPDVQYCGNKIYVTLTQIVMRITHYTPYYIYIYIYVRNYQSYLLQLGYIFMFTCEIIRYISMARPSIQSKWDVILPFFIIIDVVYF